MIVKLLSNSSCEITLLSGKERKPFPDNKCMKLNHYENQLDFRFLTDTALIIILPFKSDWYICFINIQYFFF